MDYNKRVALFVVIIIVIFLILITFLSFGIKNAVNSFDPVDLLPADTVSDFQDSLNNF